MNGAPAWVEEKAGSTGILPVPGRAGSPSYRLKMRWGNMRIGNFYREDSEALAKVVHFVIANDVKDLNLMTIRDSSLRSE
jgi:hypothetical protein